MGLDCAFSDPKGCAELVKAEPKTTSPLNPKTTRVLMGLHKRVFGVN